MLEQFEKKCEHQNYILPYHIGEEEDEEIAEYLERMAKEEVYGEQHIIDALAIVLDVQLTIIRIEANGEQRQININESEDRKVIGLRHQDEGLLAHYDALEFVDNEDEDLASQLFLGK